MEAQTLAGLMDRQRRLEEHALREGGVRWKRRLLEAQQHHRGAMVGAARTLLLNGLRPLEQAIGFMCETGKKGRPHMAAKWCRMVGPETAAYMTLKVVLEAAADQLSVTSAAFQIVELMLDELRFRRFEERAPSMFAYRLNHFETSSYAFMARSMGAAMQRSKCSECFVAGAETCPHLDCSDLDMPNSVRLQVGMKLIDLLIESTGLVTVERHTIPNLNGRRKKTLNVLVALPETQRWMQDRNDALELRCPLTLPMVVPPLPWSPDARGGYRFALSGKYTLIRRAEKSRDMSGMSTVYAAVNRIQATPWRINARVYALLWNIANRGGGLAGIPALQELPIPPKPDDFDTNIIARKAWIKLKGRVRQAERGRQGKARRFLATLDIARRFKDDKAIWFPSNCDFRGRVYPIPQGLSPQGDDVEKGLLLFADGKPLGEDGAMWLALHGANCLKDAPDGTKLSRATLQERVDWIVSHTAMLEAVARDPWEDVWWADADDPIQFFAFCVEWANYAAMDRQGRGQEYVCSLPVSQDGTCNGLQHFAALLGDPATAAAVNVLPAARPEDVYLRIAESVTQRLEQDAADLVLARLWLTSGLIDRKSCKRPTMTFGYGSGRFGFKQQLMQYLHERDDFEAIRTHFWSTADTSRDGLVGEPTNLLPSACAYLARLIWEQLGEIVPGAFTGRAWMQRVARNVVAGGNAVSWIVPETGFRVVQHYRDQRKHRVKTVLMGQIVYPTLREDGVKFDASKQANAVAPNLVHSLDAACLMLTVEQAAQAGVEHFAMVHDSYGTLPADAACLAQCTREAFYRLYAGRDVLREWVAQQPAPEGKELPEPPARGALDISQVFLADYFFC